MLTVVLLFLVAASPQDQKLAEEHYDKGAAYFRSGQLNEALTEFEQATRLAPADVRAWKGLGTAYAAQGNFRLAEGPFRKACEIDPQDQDACYYLGLASYNLSRYEGAIAAFGKALKSGGPVARVHSALGRALEALGHDEEAERELREAINKDDGKSTPDLDPHLEIGTFLFRHGRLEEALRILGEAVKARPGSARANFELARTMVQFGQLAEAAGHLKEAVRLDPSYTAAHLLLGRVYFRLGRVAEGERQTQIGRQLATAQR